jgi:hypothetical protein
VTRVKTNRSLRGAMLGVISGAVGTGAMDLVWFRRFRQGGGEGGLYEWETGKGTACWENATDPGKVGHLILRKLSGHDIDDRWARSVSNVVHWATGMVWGAQLGLLALTLPRFRREFDLLLGPTAWLSGYAVLPLVKLYKPIWKYDSRTLEKDLSAHMTFGSVTALTFAILTRSREA